MNYPIIETKKKELLIIKPGNRENGDNRLLIQGPNRAWAPTMELLGCWVREKGKVEHNNFEKTGKGIGAPYLLAFLADCLLTNMPIRELLKKYKTPDY